MFENNESPSQGLMQLSQSSKNTVEEDFLTLTPRTTIQGLKDCKEVRIDFFIFLQILLFTIISSLIFFILKGHHLHIVWNN